MSNQHSFCIRVGVAFPESQKCPLCGDGFEMSGMDIYDGNDVPICTLCGWEIVPELASLLSLSVGAHYHGRGGMPDDTFHALEKRRSDPKRLKKELQKDYDSIGPNGPLGEFLKKQIKVALDGKDVETLKSAKRLFTVAQRGIQTTSDIDDDIPF